ncbi:MAG: efflux RND transporter periplasmic adaptor subunit [Telluria sp.]
MRAAANVVTACAAWCCAAAFAAPPVPAAAPKGLPASSPRPPLEKQDIRAQLSPRRYTTLAAEIGAKVSKLSVTEGGSFRAGQVLVSLDCSLQQAQQSKAKAAQSAAEQTYAANQRLEQLHSVGKLELNISEAEVAKAKAETTLMAVALSKCQVAAPFSGRVAEQKVREQQYVQPGQPLLDIIDDSDLELEFIIPSHWLAWVKPGTQFQVRIDETGKSYPARIARVGARVDPVSQSIKVSANIIGSFHELMAGMSGKVLLAPP